MRNSVFGVLMCGARGGEDWGPDPPPPAPVVDFLRNTGPDPLDHKAIKSAFNVGSETPGKWSLILARIQFYCLLSFLRKTTLTFRLIYSLIMSHLLPGMKGILRSETCIGDRILYNLASGL